MKKLFTVLAASAFLASSGLAMAKDYQVTGPVVDVKDDAIVVKKGNENWEIAKDKDTIALGERIYRGGVADRQIAACAGCHSPTGIGIPAQYPRLSGQHAAYTAAQLTGFREGVRQNNLQMSQVAAKLNDREIKAVADYVAGLR